MSIINLSTVHVTNFLRPDILRHSRDTHSENLSDDVKETEECLQDTVIVGDTQQSQDKAKRFNCHSWFYYKNMNFLNKFLSPEMIAKRIDDAISDFPYLYSPLDAPSQGKWSFQRDWNNYRKHWGQFRHHERHMDSKSERVMEGDNHAETTSTTSVENAKIEPSPSE